MRNTIIIFLLTFSIAAFAQEDTTEVFDYSQFGDAEGVKRFCTQKVLNQVPQRIISVGYEYHGGFDMPGVKMAPLLPAFEDFRVEQVSAIRAQANIPVISTNRIIWQLGANYWSSKFAIQNPGNNSFASSLNTRSMTTAGINTTIFKPLNEKNFLIAQASADMNGVFQNLSDINNKAVTVSGTLIYGWKKSERNMIGTGISRTYRAGQILHIPVLLWNKTFNDRWGMELLLPARGHVRYNFSPSNILQLGFELEGNQFWMNQPGTLNDALFVQRGEMKPRVIWDRKINGFFWLSAQAGLRYNWRFDVMNDYDAKEDSQRYFSSRLGNPFYFNISLNFVSP
jgi:hypothetical protein